MVILVVFLIYAVVNDPRQSGNFVGDIWDWVTSAADSIGTFFDTMLSS
ncbi:hypothetical protein KIH74_00085 [Kineosporia sp. J2-2]|uniref:Uncharacterized protein n=1 Tax=Kineosporia corallincola TaxID=2835133 RepID=A0ABS5T8A4_9ACTN|nr:hypothetical protein [Kineosporia corallincola]MBT0767302.1 hypothetical protein [Kineosporia corallincola]